MILRSMAAGAIVIGLMSLARNVQTILILRILQGLFCGTVTASAALVAAGTPRERLSYALGFLASSTFIGYSLGPFFGGLAGEYFGYRVAFLVGSAILAIGFIGVLFFIKEVKAPPVEKGEHRKVERMGRDVKVVFVMVLILLFLVRFSRSLPYSFVPLYVQEVRGTIEGSSAVMGIISSLLGVAAALAGLTVARLGDRHDKIWLIAVLLAAGFALTVPLFFTRGLVGFSALYICAGFAMGGIEPNLQSFVTERTPQSRRGLIFGLQTMVGSFGWFFAPLTATAIAINMSIRHIYLFFAAAVGLSCLVVLVFKMFGVDRIGGASRRRVERAELSA